MSDRITAARSGAFSTGIWKTSGFGVAIGIMLVGLAYEYWPRGAVAPAETSSAIANAWGIGQPFPAPITAAPAPAPAPKAQQAAAPTPAPAPVDNGIKPMGFVAEGNSAGTRVGSGQGSDAATDKAALDGLEPGQVPPAQKSEYAQRMQATQFADAEPTPRYFHEMYTLKKGDSVDCLSPVPISSMLPGPISCVTTQDAWSMDHTTRLIPAYSEVNGQVERGIGNGENRLFVIWTDVLTPLPHRRDIPLDSPAGDEAGQVGVPGNVNEHLWRKLKTALLLSAVQIGGNVGVSAATQGSNNVYLNGLSGAGNTGENLAGMAFGHDLNIPDTLERGKSRHLTILVNHFIDLHKFYENRLAR